MKRLSIVLLSLVALAVAPSAAAAFCGFYVGSAGETLYNDATQVVLMRSGTRTVLSMQQSYKGPPEDFAMVVPVPVVLQKKQVVTLPRDVFTKVDRLDAPRLVEYWEQDPCPQLGLGNYGTIGHGSGTGSGYGVGSGRGGMAKRESVRVEAKFTVGEYDIVILSATDALGLEEWLAEHKYKIPAGAAPYLKPYVESGSKFFVAKVDTAKVKMESGRAVLSPLRFHYDSESFNLPIRLGLANSAGVQDLIVHILAPSRFEVANYPNVLIPTNLVVRDEARDRFGEFYAALFDRTVEENKGAVVTEYAWGSNTCDPCPTSPLSDADTATLGGDVLGLVAVGTSGSTRMADPKVTGAGKMDPAILRRYLRRITPRMAACGAGPQPLVVEFDIEANGSTSKVKVSGASGAAQSCIAKAVDDMELPKPKGGGVAHVRAPVVAGFGGGGGGGLILTRLHARYGVDTIGEDLVFREAAPIVGGRGVPDPSGKLPEGEQAAGVPQFQARYVMMHPWTGPIGCAQPQRGIWGGPPAGKEAPAARPALDLATAKRGAIDLTAMIAEAAQAAPAPVAEEAITPRPEPAPEVKPKRPRRGDGCAAGGGSGMLSLWLAAAALVLARVRARAGSPRPRRARRPRGRPGRRAGWS